MAIYANIDGTEKSVKQPYINIDGVWKEVESEYTNIEGTWKPVFESKETYTINIYKYGALHETLTCTEGDSIKLPSIGSGYAIRPSSTAINYSNGATITPTSNMDLYTVFTYYVYLYKYGSSYQTLSAKSQGSTAVFTLPSASVDSGDNAFDGWAVSNGSTSKSYNGGSSYSLSTCWLYAVFSYYTYTEQKSASTTAQTSGDSSSTQSLTASLTNPLPGSSWSATVQEWTPNQVTYSISSQLTSGTGYAVNYIPKDYSSPTGAVGSGTSITVVSSYKPSGGAFTEGALTGHQYSGETNDTRKTVYKYSYLKADIKYTTYTSKTLAYRSSK